MSTGNDQHPSSTVATAVSVLRGLLAEPSGNEDDPWARVVFKQVETPDGDEVFFTLDVPDDEAAPDALRERIRGELDTFCTRHGTPVAVRAEDTVYRVERPVVTPEQPLADKVALVTGAAGAIGTGICGGLLDKGCRVAATDLDREHLSELVDELGREADDRITGVHLDVTDPVSVARAFEYATRAWGGVDIVVVNAGIAMAAPLAGTELDAFRRLEKVNVEGTLLTLAEAGRVLTRQGTGGDVVLVSSKNVFSPGAGFGAFSATKAAAHQWARIASLEMAPQGVRVNMVAPDAVFSAGRRKSGLWAEVGPSRMKARNLDEAGLEEYYRNRNLLKMRVTATHVANAVLFFVTRQTPTTGATLPVDGGLPDSTPR
jgi:NAD(P)-dependent dehydrogenase (short-subunit alcohol dehydrogenase family)